MTKLLLYVDDRVVDQILMVVPDDYDEEQAGQEARDYLTADTYLKETWKIDDDRAHYAIGPYRPHVG